MKKVQFAMVVMAMMLVLSGCTNYAKTYDNNTLVLKGNGSLVEIAVEDFSESSVNAEDVTSYVEEQIDDFNQEAGSKSVKKQSMNTSDMSKVKLVLTYKDMDSFNAFNSLECSLSDFEDVKESDDLKGKFQSVEEESVKVAGMTDVDKAKVLILSEATDVVLNGDLLYYNDQVSVKDGVITTSGEDNAIIIFK
jgi:hypothetical protein